jgi:adenosine deaminase
MTDPLAQAQSLSLAEMPKAELHVHIEGTISAALAQKMAARKGIDLPDEILSEDRTAYRWDDDGTGRTALLGFLKAYHSVTKAVNGQDDYFDMAYDYLARAAAEQGRYVEFIISNDHARDAGLSYAAMVDAIVAGAEKARADFGIECRLITSIVRDFGIDRAFEVVQAAIQYPHPYVTGLTMAGNENAHSVLDFKRAFEMARDAGLHLTAHAGEAAGPESVRACLEILGIKRFGHMVRAIEDEDLMARLRDHGAVPEICLSSNLALKLYQTAEAHPLKEFMRRGFAVTLATDDPAFFNCTLLGEYQLAHEKCGLSLADLDQIYQNTIKHAFCDDALKDKLLKRQ